MLADRERCHANRLTRQVAPLTRPAMVRVFLTASGRNRANTEITGPSPVNTTIKISGPSPVNAATEIKKLKDALTSSEVSDEVRSYDLVWPLHLVGDAHQPLHA